MSFKEQKIIRLYGRIAGNVNIIGVVYEDGRKETIVHEVRKEKGSWQSAPLFRMRGCLGERVLGKRKEPFQMALEKLSKQLDTKL